MSTTSCSQTRSGTAILRGARRMAWTSNRKTRSPEPAPFEEPRGRRRELSDALRSIAKHQGSDPKRSKDGVQGIKKEPTTVAARGGSLAAQEHPKQSALPSANHWPRSGFNTFAKKA